MRGVEIDAAARRARVEAGAVWTDVTDPGRRARSRRAGGLLARRRRRRLHARRRPLLALPPPRPGGQQRHRDRARDGRRPPGPRRREQRARPVLGAARRRRQLRRRHRDRDRAAADHARLRRRDVLAQERAREVLQAWRGVDAPGTAGRDRPRLDGSSTSRRSPRCPSRCAARSFIVVEIDYLGDEEEGAELIAPLRALARRSTLSPRCPPSALSHLHMDPEQPVAGQGRRHAARRAAGGGDRRVRRRRHRRGRLAPCCRSSCASSAARSPGPRPSTARLARSTPPTRCSRSERRPTPELRADRRGAGDRGEGGPRPV